MSVISAIRYVDPSYTVLINGTTHSVTGEELIFGLNAFSVLDDAVSVLPAGGVLFVNGLSSDISIPDAVSLYLTDSTAPLLLVGPDTAGASYSGGIDTFISGSTFGAETSWLVGRLGTIDGDVSIVIEDSVIGFAAYTARETRQLGLAEDCTFGKNTESISLTVRDSTILEDVNLFHESVLGTPEKPVSVVFTMERVTVPNDKWFWLSGSTQAQSSYADVTFNLSDSAFGNNGTMALSVNHDLGCGDAFKGNITYNVDDISFHGNLYPVSLSTCLRPADNTGIFTLNVSGGYSFIESVGGFDEINIAAGACLSAVSFQSNRKIYVSGELRAPTVSSGEIHLLSGGTISGPLDLTDATVATVEAGSEIQFDISGRSAGGADSDAQIKQLSAFGNIPDFALSISALQERGTYTLATGATGFDKTITVRNSFDGSTLGTLSVGQKADFLGLTCELTLSAADVLRLSVSKKEIVPASLDGLTVRSGQTYGISTSQTVSDVTVSRGGSLLVSSDGSVENATVNFGGSMTVFKGGTASAVEVLPLGTLFVSSGGTAMEILENGGFVNVHNLADVTFVPNTISGLVLSRGSASIHSGTTACDVSLSYGGWVYVYGGVLSNASVNANGHLNVSSGGTASGVEVNVGGNLDIRSGGTVAEIRENGGYVSLMDDANVTFAANTFSGLVLSNAGATVHSGTTANSTTVDLYGMLYVSSGGIAENTTVNYGGEMRIFSDGVAENTAVNSGGRLYVSSGGIAENITVNSGGEMSISSGGIAENTTVNSGGRLYVSSGGTAGLVEVNVGGRVEVKVGTTMEIRENGGAVVGDGTDVTFVANTFSGLVLNASATVHSGTTAKSTTVNSGGRLYVSSGGIAENTTVNSGGTLYISSGGTAGSVEVNVGGRVQVKVGTAMEIRENGGAVIGDGTNVTFVANTFSGLALNASATVHSGTTAKSTTVNLNGRLYVSSGGIAENTMVNSRGYMSISSDGIAENTTVNLNGSMYVDSGGTAMEIRENGGYVYVADGANVRFVANTFSGLVLTNASATVHSGTTANSTLVNVGMLYVSSGGIAENTTVNFDGMLYVSSGGIAENTAVNPGGNMFISSGGIAENTTVNTDGYLFVNFGGIADSVEVNNEGALFICEGGKANGVTVNEGGSAEVSSGVIDGTVVNAGGGLLVYSGAKLTGRMTFESGAEVIPFVGSILDFDLTQTSAGSVALVNDLSILLGTPSYTLTVDGTQEDGTYNLAGGASSFKKTITVVTTAGIELGTLTVGETVRIGDSSYTLNLNGGTLSVEIVSKVIPDWTFYNGDFNGAGKALLAVESEGSITIYANCEPWGNGLVLEDGWEVVGTGDFSGDGLDDFLRVNGDGYVVGEMSNGNGTFSAQVLNFKDTGWDILGTGDFNANGTDDILIANPTGASDTVGLLGYWESGVTWTLINGYSAEWECVATGDYNGDGKCDMLWKNQFVGEGGLLYNAYCTWIVDDPVDWRMVSVANPREWNFLCSGDFDGDKRNDIAMINDVGVVGIWGVNDGYLSSWSILSAVTNEWQLAGVADYNGDGTDDIAWCSSTTGQVGAWIVQNKELSDWQVLANIV